MRSSGKLRVDRREQTVTRNVESVEEAQCLRATCRRTQVISDSRRESGELGFGDERLVEVHGRSVIQT